MMRILVLLAAAAAALPGMPARADAPLPPGNILLAKDVAVVPMAEWDVAQTGRAEQTGARILIAAGADDVAKAPANASRYDSQTFSFSPGAFSTGELRVLSFKAAGGGVLHQITTETELYVVKGSGIVGVQGVPTEIHAGDVVNLPSGVLRSIPGKAEDTVILAFTVAGTAKDSKAVVLREKDVKLTPMKDGPKTGVGGTKLAVRRYTFDGNSIRVAHLSGRGSTTPYTGGTDVILYILAGPLRITVGDEVRDVSAGDVVREQAGKTSFWNVSGKGVFVATNSPPRYAAAR